MHTGWVSTPESLVEKGMSKDVNVYQNCLWEWATHNKKHRQVLEYTEEIENSEDGLRAIDNHYG